MILLSSKHNYAFYNGDVSVGNQLVKYRRTVEMLALAPPILMRNLLSPMVEMRL